jgi:succinoglycan biosynthesis transport protein ExoP
MNRQQVRSNSSSISVKDCLEALKQHAHLTFLSSLLLAILGIIGVSLLPNIYRATTTILVDPQKIPERYVASTITTDPNARLNTLTQQVLSDSRLQEILDKDNLYPELQKKKSREEVLDYMRQKTKIELKQTPQPDQGLSSFSISYEDEDRSLVANIANHLASSFIEWNLRVRQQQALGTTEFLSNELQQAKKSLEEQESQLEVFKMKHAGGTPDELNGNLQALSRLQAETQSNADAISRLDQERILLTQVKPTELRDTASLTERGRMLQENRRLESELWNLKRQFTDTYPDVIAVKEQLKNLNARLAAMPEQRADSTDSYDTNSQIRLGLIDKELQRHKQQQVAIQQQIQSYQWKVDSVPVLETQLVELTRNYETSRQNYQSLLDKTFSAGMSEELERTQQGKRFTVLDSAKTPEKPIRPDRVLFIAGVLVLALLLPASTTIGVYLMKGSVKSDVELKEMLPFNIQVLGIIPPIVSQADLRHARMLTVRTVLVSIISCTALIIFLLKVRPTL